MASWQFGFHGIISPENLVGFNGNTVDGWNPANQFIGSLSHYLYGFIHPRWCKISAINSSTRDPETNSKFTPENRPVLHTPKRKQAGSSAKTIHFQGRKAVSFRFRVCVSRDLPAVKNHRFHQGHWLMELFCESYLCYLKIATMHSDSFEMSESWYSMWCHVYLALSLVANQWAAKCKVKPTWSREIPGTPNNGTPLW